ncbi:MmpS family transport accessory protein [Clavibacter sp. Sh2141]|uniref:MmpS family transport accessory protein n=1 Tax=Clavibacter sp. Sh2141 TaxID=3395374 RepID=UPI0039BC6BBC
MTFRYAPEPEPTGPRERKTTNPVGLAALIVGIVALVGSVIPLVNYGSGFVAFVGIVLGIIGLVLADRPKGTALGGLVVSVVALVLSVLLAIAYTVGIATLIGTAVEDSQTTSGAESQDDAIVAGDVTVTYELSGTLPAVDAAYTSLVDDALITEEVTGQPLPFSAEAVLPSGTDYEDERLILVGTGGADAGDLTCRILVDGDLLVEQTASGAGARAACVVTAAEVRSAAG